jgi:hypothetical protein
MLIYPNPTDQVVYLTSTPPFTTHPNNSVTLPAFPPVLCPNNDKLKIKTNLCQWKLRKMIPIGRKGLKQGKLRRVGRILMRMGIWVHLALIFCMLSPYFDLMLCIILCWDTNPCFFCSPNSHRWLLIQIHHQL